jgi:hypothetical protein
MRECIRFFWYPLPVWLGLLILFQAFTFMFFRTLHLDFMVSCMGFGCAPTIMSTWFIFPLSLTLFSYTSIKDEVIPFIKQGGEWLQTAYSIFALTLYLGLYGLFDFYRQILS